MNTKAQRYSLGIDVAFSKPQYLAVLLEKQGRLRVDRVISDNGNQRFTRDSQGIEALAQLIAREYPVAPLGIDAPRTPLADCNDNRSCGRRCERDCSSLRIKIFYTPCLSFFTDWGLECPHGNYAKQNQKPRWMQVGFDIYAGLQDRQAFEVFPHATFCRLLWAVHKGLRLSSKQSPVGIEQRKRLLVAYGLDLGDYANTRNADELDAVAAAFTARCANDGQAEYVGDEEEGQIVIPVLTPPDNHGYLDPVPRISRPQGPDTRRGNQSCRPSNLSRIKSQNGSESIHEPTEEEREAILRCTILKNPGRGDIVYCADCGEMRVVNPQDFFQVTRCHRCQQAERRRRRRERD